MSNTHDDPNQLLKIAELTKWLGCNAATLHRWRGETALGFPAAIYVGNTPRWRRADVLAWLAARERQGRGSRGRVAA